jgi:glycosyltransferase involved in cell wall biosynthesis
MCGDIVESFQASRWLGNCLFWFDDVADAALAAFYRRSHALLFAPLAEGFGLPLIEAASCSSPILARDTPTSREILRSHGVYFATADDMIGGVRSFEDAGAMRWCGKRSPASNGSNGARS